MKTDNKVPNDLKKYARNYALKRIIQCILLIILFGTVLAFWAEVIFPTKNTSFRALCCIAVMLLPFVITGVPAKLFDRTYCGTVEQVTVETTVDSDSKTKSTWQTLYWKNTVYLTVRCEDGKQIKSKVQAVRANSSHNVDVYKVGDKVFHLYGSKHTIILPTKVDSYAKCAVCGTSNDIGNDECRHCGYSLVK